MRQRIAVAIIDKIKHAIRGTSRYRFLMLSKSVSNTKMNASFFNRDMNFKEVDLQ